MNCSTKEAGLRKEPHSPSRLKKSPHKSGTKIIPFRFFSRPGSRVNSLLYHCLWMTAFVILFLPESFHLSITQFNFAMYRNEMKVVKKIAFQLQKEVMAILARSEAIILRKLYELIIKLLYTWYKKG